VLRIRNIVFRAVFRTRIRIKFADWIWIRIRSADSDTAAGQLVPKIQIFLLLTFLVNQLPLLYLFPSAAQPTVKPIREVQWSESEVPEYSEVPVPSAYSEIS
jgi:hypothetical protein